METHQLIIIGGGPAGLTAAIYAGRSQLKTLVVTAQPGGMISWAHQVENFPGHHQIGGQQLAQQLIEQAESWQARTIIGEVTGITQQNGLFLVQTNDNQTHQAETVLLALGTQKRKLNLPREDKYLGRGLSYCALCDGHFFKGKTVAVCGGGDAAATTAIYLASLAEKVYLIARRAGLSCCPSWAQRIDQHQNIELICANEILELVGSDHLTALKMKEPHQGRPEISVEGLFIEIGTIPSSLLAKQLGLKLDPDGFIEIDPAGRTSHPGIWAAGDITTGSNKLWQAITACAEGAIAADSIYRHLKKKDQSSNKPAATP